mgnify:FL=1
MEKEFIYNKNKIKMLEEKIENILNKRKEDNINLYKNINKKDKQSRKLKNISKGILITSLVTFIISIIVMTVGTLNIPLLIIAILILFPGLDMYKDSLDIKREIEKDKLDIEMNSKIDGININKIEEELEIRNILNDCIESNYITKEDQNKIKDKILMNDLENQFNSLELIIFNKTPQDKKIEILDRKRNLTIEQLRKIKEKITNENKEKNEILSFIKEKEYLKKI